MRQLDEVETLLLFYSSGHNGSWEVLPPVGPFVSGSITFVSIFSFKFKLFSLAISERPSSEIPSCYGLLKTNYSSSLPHSMEISPS